MVWTFLSLTYCRVYRKLASVFTSMVHTGCFSMELIIVHFPVPHTPRLLYLASLGEPLPLDGENLFWVQTLLRGGYIRAEVVPDEHATQLLCRLTPLGESFFEYFNG